MGFRIGLSRIAANNSCLTSGVNCWGKEGFDRGEGGMFGTGVGWGG